MVLAVTQCQEITVIALEGSVDGKTAPELQAEILPVVAPLAQVILDLARVDYMSSAGLRMLLTLYRQFQAQKGRIALVGVSEDIRDVMSHTGFIGFFTLADTPEAAVAQLRGQS
ncbi:STAS domain-containing protein [Pararhodospirillum photometricum]|uniref:Anti-sigma factor antagonist n=1 Tax=Pararhodospirillum photometricum DSM 122 TaxID=1150469 RepID=H6SNS6_PARPM|nr:STAS domain-containing protein [Pararhodospirillum photometricum]CCG06998.1 Anti-sigma-factor antagonist [Pararhodospirillum photometricum DSM 122]